MLLVTKGILFPMIYGFFRKKVFSIPVYVQPFLYPQVQSCRLHIYRRKSSKVIKKQLFAQEQKRHSSHLQELHLFLFSRYSSIILLLL